MSILINPSSLYGKQVEVYWNLHKDVFSVRDRKTRLVIAHVDWIPLVDVTFKVSEAGRQRVLAEGRKNVHAFVQGTVGTVAETAGGTLGQEVISVSYNPHRGPWFYDRSDDTPLASAAAVRMLAFNNDGVTKATIFAKYARALDTAAVA